MGSHIRIGHVAAFMLPVVGLFAVLLLLPQEALAAELRDGLRDGLHGVAAAEPGWLGLTGLLLSASIAGSALACP